MPGDAFKCGRDFIYGDGRLLERRLFAALFEDGRREAVVNCLRGYQNADGGFGHALEPDKRAPDSQPLDVQFALQTLDAVDLADRDMLRRACEFLDSVADDSGAVPIVLPSIAAYPRAAHWGDGEFPPSLSPTIATVGLLYRFAVEHPWRERAANYCFTALESEPPTDAHAIRDALIFLEHTPERERAEILISRVVGDLPDADYFLADANDERYGLRPLAFAPKPASRWRTLFRDDEIDAHLDALAAEQEEDGGWPLRWQPPSEAARCEWRGIETLQALRVLVAYERVSAQ
jgi:hypothetical protein